MSKWNLVIRYGLFAILSTSEAHSQAIDLRPSAASTELLDPSVFDSRIYAAIHPQLAGAGLSTKQLQQDWLAHGVQNCLRASPAFDPKQYLQLYPSVGTATGGDCTAATLEFVRHGRLAGRRGTTTNSTFGGTLIDEAGRSQAIFGNELITMHASARFGFSIDSLFFRGKEFIDSWDHGRELQWAWTNYGMGECNNPTEGGSQDDFQRWTSTTEVAAVSAGPSQGGTTTANGLSTMVFPAYWLRPGQTTEHCRAGRAHPNPALVDKDQPTSKKVTLGFHDDPGIIVYVLTIDNHDEAVPDVTVEGPTAYLADDFDHFYAFLSPEERAREIDMRHWHSSSSLDAGETPYPVILSTADKKYAMGVFSPDQLGQVPIYGLFHFKHGKDSPQKWNVFYRWSATNSSDNAAQSSLPQGKTTFQTYLAIGNLTEVERSLSLLTTDLRASATQLLFDDGVYRALHPRLADLSWIASSEEWYKNGLGAGLRASFIYDPAFYKAELLKNNQSVPTSWPKLEQSFLGDGLTQGVQGSLEFDPHFYLSHNPDVASQIVSAGPASEVYFRAARHWLWAGLKEGRDGSADFSPSAYLNRYPDVQTRCGPTGYRCASIHWLTLGVSQGRNGKR